MKNFSFLVKDYFQRNYPQMTQMATGQTWENMWSDLVKPLTAHAEAPRLWRCTARHHDAATAATLEDHAAMARYIMSLNHRPRPDPHHSAAPALAKAMQGCGACVTAPTAGPQTHRPRRSAIDPVMSNSVTSHGGPAQVQPTAPQPRPQNRPSAVGIAALFP